MSFMFSQVSTSNVQATTKLASFIGSAPSSGPVRCHLSGRLSPTSADCSAGSVTPVTTHSESVASRCDWSGHSDRDLTIGGVYPQSGDQRWGFDPHQDRPSGLLASGRAATRQHASSAAEPSAARRCCAGIAVRSACLHAGSTQRMQSCRGWCVERGSSSDEVAERVTCE